MNGKQLRASILQEAIAGRLVSQNPSDEPASKLLKRIAPNATPLQDDVPYEIPDNWAWCRLGSVCDVARGGSPRPIEKYLTDAENGVNWIKIGDTKPDDKYVRSVKQKIKPEGVSRSRFVHKGDFLLTNSMSFGRPYILDVDGCIHDGWLVISPMSGVYDKDFLYYLLSSAFAYSQFSRKASGGVVNNLNSEKVSNSVFPLPPLAEQKRIVAKIEELMPLVDEYEKAQEEFDNLNAGLKGKLRASLLQEAIAGRLVPQDPNDEPASELLKKIRKEKEKLIKEGKLPKDKNETLIFRGDDKKFYEQKGKTVTCIDDQIPFEIPDSWEWCRMGDISNVCSARRVHKSDWRTAGIPFYRTREIGHLADFGYVDNELFIDKELYKAFSQSGVPKQGDLMITAVGTLGKVYVVQPNDVFYYKDASVLCLQNKYALCPQYLKLAIESPFFIEQYTKESRGTTVLTLTIEKLSNHLIPLPPLAEQKRIVEKLESMFAVLDNLDACGD